MPMTTDEKLDTYNELQQQLDNALTSKKNEATMLSGGAKAAQELMELHSSFILKIKDEMQTSVTSGTLDANSANLALGWISKTSKVISDFLITARARCDIKTGEALSFNSIIQFLASKQEKLKAEQELALQTEQELPTEITEESVASTDSERENVAACDEVETSQQGQLSPQAEEYEVLFEEEAPPAVQQKKSRRKRPLPLALIVDDLNQRKTAAKRRKKSDR